MVGGEPVVLRTNYYPAWRAYLNDREIPLHDASGQLAFNAPESGSYIVRLAYPRYWGVSAFAVFAFAAGVVLLWRRAPAVVGAL